MPSSVSDILESDVAVANERMRGAKSSDGKDKSNEVIILILFVILIIGILAYFEEKRNRAKNKFKLKLDNEDVKEIDLKVSDLEIENALEALNNS